MDLLGRFEGLPRTLYVPQWNYQGNLESFLERHTYLGGMHLIVQASSDNVHTSVRCLWYFIYWYLPQMVQVVHACLDGPCLVNSWGSDLEGTFHNCLFYLLPLFQGMFFHSWALFLGKAHSGLVLVQGIMLT